jgi:AcrR family transcriptional regulator
MTTSVPSGLRERKKAKTRAAIREHAMRLFEEQGYAGTTMDQIAAAADVSQSTFFRYFPSKEDVVLTDEFDPLIAAAMRAQPPGLPPIETLRRAIRTVFDNISEEDWHREQQCQRLVQSFPELRARVMQEYVQTIELLADVFAERAGLPAGDFSARVLAGAVIGAILAAVPHGFMSTVERGDFTDMDAALDLVRDGLPLGGVPSPDGRRNR